MERLHRTQTSGDEERGRVKGVGVDDMWRPWVGVLCAALRVGHGTKNRGWSGCL